MRKSSYFIVTCFLILTITFSLCSRKPTEIKVGAILPLTGKYAEYGKNSRDAIDLAIYEISEKYDLKIKMIYEDDQASPQMAINSMRKLLDIDKVKVVIGGFTSASSVAIEPLAEEAKIILFSPSSSTPQLTENTPYFFRNWPSDEIQARNFAHLTYEKFDIKRVATIYSQSDYGVSVNRIFVDEFKKIGGKVLVQESYMPKSTDFRSQIIKIKKENPDSVWLFGYYNEMGYFLKQAKELGLTVQFFGQEGIEGQELIDIAGNAADGLIYFVPYFDVHDINSNVRNFVESFRSKYGRLPEVFAAHAYDAINILSQAIKEKGYDPDAIRDYILSLQNYQGVSGLTSFDSNGDAQQPLMIKQIRNREFRKFQF